MADTQEGAGGMMDMMATMMPRMMEGMKAEDMMAMMGQMMPVMMDRCFSMMDEEQRRDTLGMCRGVLDQMEAKYLP